jgi:hypothetical protein
MLLLDDADAPPAVTMKANTTIAAPISFRITISPRRFNWLRPVT